MKRLTLLIAFCAVANIVSAQTPALPTSDAILDSLTKLAQRYLNAQQSDSLYALMGTPFKKEISADTMKAVSEGLNAQLGKWVSSEPTGVVNGVGSYKATFALMVLNFYISRDTDGKVETFLFKP